MELSTQQILQLHAFLKESNKIEGVLSLSSNEIDTAAKFLENPERINFFKYQVATAPGNPLRINTGMNVHVGNYAAPLGGREVEKQFSLLMTDLRFTREPTAYDWHQRYEQLHPFMDGNGRTGRLGWLYKHLIADTYMGLGFLHQWYYESLENWRE